MCIRRSLFAFVGLLVVTPAWAGEDIGEIRCVQFSPNGRLAAFASNRSVKLWDTATKRKVGELKGHSDNVHAFAFAPDGKTLFTCSRDATARQWDLSSGKELRRFEGHKFSVMSVAVSADGKTLVTAGGDGVRIWDVASGKELRQFTKHTGFVSCVTLSPNGSQAVSADADHVRLWTVETAKEIRTFVGNQGFVPTVAFTPDGKQLITGGADGLVRVWDVDSGKERLQCAGHMGNVFFVTVSPDGRTIASAGHDSTLRLWDASTGRELKKIDCHSPGVLSVGFSPDGRELISGGYDCNVNLWETVTGKLRLEYTPNTKPPDKPPEMLTAAKLETLWKTLEGDDAQKAYEAVLTLSARPQEVVPFLQKQLKAATDKVDGKQIQKWIIELNDDEFSTRENAQAELQKLGHLARVPMQNALAKTKSVEMKRRLQEILKGLDKNDLPARTLLEMRALEVLENANTTEARKLLETLASGTAEAELTAAAKASLARLAKKPRQP